MYGKEDLATCLYGLLNWTGTNQTKAEYSQPSVRAHTEDTEPHAVTHWLLVYTEAVEGTVQQRTPGKVTADWKEVEG